MSRGLDIKIIQERMGCSDRATASKIYADMYYKLKVNVAKDISHKSQQIFRLTNKVLAKVKKYHQLNQFA